MGTLLKPYLQDGSQMRFIRNLRHTLTNPPGLLHPFDINEGDCICERIVPEFDVFKCPSIDMLLTDYLSPLDLTK